MPGCSNRGTLFAHHVVFRSHGGRTAIENEVCLCQSCHSLVHDGLLTVEGDVPHGLRWNGPEGRTIETRLTADHGTKRYTLELGRNDPRGSRAAGVVLRTPVLGGGGRWCPAEQTSCISLWVTT